MTLHVINVQAVKKPSYNYPLFPVQSIKFINKIRKNTSCLISWAMIRGKFARVLNYYMVFKAELKYALLFE